ncbi:hypothetical protein F5Y19DRAFT_492630 [Xylariaceae sp. FL1651]|nr:hypothetical protein F5Y19DRAFT_492630 [Xylariaceae sp. FL1651]
MTPIRNLLRRCVFCYPILQSLLSHLGSTESAAFIQSIGLLGHVEVQGTVNKFSNLLRDMPEMADWMRAMISKGHSVWLAGRDLVALKSRISDPNQYWNQGNGENTIRLWVMVKATAADQELSRRRQKKPQTYYQITENGDVVWSGTPEMELKAGIWGNVVPLPGTFLPTDPSPENGWLKSTVPNNNNIEFVCCHYGHNISMFSGSTNSRIPIFRICPMSREKTHDAKLCSEQYGPGALRMEIRDAAGSILELFTVPYINVCRYLSSIQQSQDMEAPTNQLNMSFWRKNFDAIEDNVSANIKGGPVVEYFTSLVAATNQAYDNVLSRYGGQFAMKLACNGHEVRITRELQLVSDTLV